MEKLKKHNVSVPLEFADKMRSITDSEERNNLIRAMNLAGWTQSSIARATGISRERVRQICSMTGLITSKESIEMPEPPTHAVKPKRQFVEPDAEVLARMLELQPKVQQVRSHATRFRTEAEEYTSLLADQHFNKGVPLYRMAKRLGVTHSALRFRLARYGYLESFTGTSKVYQPIKPENRAI
jgi:transcriptional regulator with XRE-family HTH domain